MLRKATGQYVTSLVGGEAVRAFVPDPLPPRPPMQPDEALTLQIERANVALGRLDGVSAALPDTRLFLYSYVRKEAVLSSQIEGTQSSLSDLMLFELDAAPGVPFDDVVEVSNYVTALEHGLARIRAGMPLSNRLIREMHERLMARGRGAGKSPGEFRRSQNWIGGSRPGDASFVPPPHTRVEGVLAEPLLYLSLYFKRNREEYYERLGRVRQDGDWEEWVRFFARGVEETANEAFAVAQRLRALAAADRARVQELGRGAGSALRVHEALQARPLATVASAAKSTGLSVPAVTGALAALGRLGVVREVTGRKRGRVFAYSAYLEALQGE